MPELPEVETVVRGLRPILEGRTIARVETNAPKSSIELSRSFGKESFASVLAGRTVEDVTRRGKNILIRLSGDVTLWVHLKMTGRMLWMPAAAPASPHDLVTIDLAEPHPDPDFHIRFNDYRRFGRLRLFPNNELWQHPGLAALGPEPLEMSASDFIALCRSGSRMIKPALLDQSFIVGVGNIYADESLFAARIHPRRLTNSLSPAKLSELHAHLQRLLKKAIKMSGTSVDSYAGVNGQPGRFQNYLKAYGHEGDPCDHCGRPLKREKIGSRSACFCPSCQRLSKSRLRPDAAPK